MPKNKSKEAYLVPARKARLYRNVLVAKCLLGCAEGPCQGQPLSPRKCFKNVLGTGLEGTFECKARLENAESFLIVRHCQDIPEIGKPQMWERAHVGFGGTGRKRKGPCTKQCAWRKHGSSDTRLAEACPPKLRNTVKYRVEEMRPKWPFWKHRAPKMRLVEAQCAHRKHCYPEIPLGSPPTSRASQ